MSDGIEQITGYPASEFIGNEARTYASVIHPDDRRRGRGRGRSMRGAARAVHPRVPGAHRRRRRALGPRAGAGCLRRRRRGALSRRIHLRHRRAQAPRGRARAPRLPRRSDRAAQPPAADGGPRARRRSPAARVLRPRRLQGLQRLLRPSGGRPPAAPAGPQASAARSAPWSRLPPRGRRVLRPRADARDDGRDARRGMPATRSASGARASRCRPPGAASCFPTRRRTPPPRSSWPTSACTQTRAWGAYRRSSRLATSSCACWRSGTPTCTSTRRGGRAGEGGRGAHGDPRRRSSTTSSVPPSCTTSARSRSPTGSSTSRARSTPRSGASSAATR